MEEAAAGAGAGPGSAATAVSGAISSDPPISEAIRRRDVFIIRT
jgi:hypothetical protein